MHKIWLIHIAFLAIGITTRAQTITIISAHTNEPLPFATIQNLRAQSAVVSSEKGTFSFNENNSKRGDSMLITYTGYSPIRMLIPNVEIILKMEPLPAMLKPVDVIPCQGNQIGILRNFKKNKSDLSFACNEKGVATYAAYLSNEQQVKGIISTIQFSLQIGHVPKTAIGAPLKVRLLKYDEKTQLPGEPLLLKELVIHPTGKEVVIDFSDEWIRLPETGIVVAIDFFFSDEKFIYSMKSTYTSDNGKKADTVMYYYGPDIKYLKGDNLIGKGFHYNYHKNTWYEAKYSNDKKIAPKIELTMKLCD